MGVTPHPLVERGSERRFLPITNSTLSNGPVQPDRAMGQMVMLTSPSTSTGDAWVMPWTRCEINHVLGARLDGSEPAGDSQAVI